MAVAPQFQVFPGAHRSPVGIVMARPYILGESQRNRPDGARSQTYV